MNQTKPICVFPDTPGVNTPLQHVSVHPGFNMEAQTGSQTEPVPGVMVDIFLGWLVGFSHHHRFHKRLKYLRQVSTVLLLVRSVK